MLCAWYETLLLLQKETVRTLPLLQSIASKTQADFEIKEVVMSEYRVLLFLLGYMC